AKSSDSTGTATRDSIKVHDEITGKNMEIYFKNGKTDSIRVSGMAISYYNVLEDSIIQGVNITSGDTVVMTFQNGKISLITVIGGTQGRFIPDRTNEKVDTTVIYSSERIDYFLNDKVTNLIERSSIKSGDLALTAGKISIDWNKNLLYAFPLGIPPYDSITGNVPTLNQKGTEPFSGESMVYNMRTQKGRIIEGATKVEDGFYYGSDIHKTDKEVFYVSDGIYTTCDIPEHPHYYFKSKKMKLIQKDKIIARPIVLYIHDIPILGLPFGIFPNKGGRRHSGWIMPTYGENKSVGGFIKGLGYFWAPNDYMDLRFTGDFFDKKGIIFHYKTRYSLRYKFNGSLNGSYSNDFFSNFPERQWSLNVNHSHKISPTMRLSINGRFVSSDSYYRKMGINRDTRLNQQLISNATLSKTWPGKPYSLSMNF
ncbi:MAG: LPS-assembly protein LptD, partial [Candidatus Marinimicrobia bacterium]|nr:LPS-assembly protein LptD [Candidatus Neomarinimicrobiota bacterium]